MTAALYDNMTGNSRVRLDRMEGLPMLIAPRYGAAYLTALTLALAAPLCAQEAAPSRISGEKILAVARTETRPVIDGVLDDAVWANAPSMDDMHQFEPVDHGEPSERTEVWILYDSDNLYVAARMWDSEPDQIRARQMVQHGTLRFDDSIGIYLDPFNNNRTGYNFQVNPNSSREDGVFETPTRQNRDWEGIWFAEAAIDDNGWTAEFEIPFKTLSFNPDNADWGFTVERSIARHQEDIDRPPPGRYCLGFLQQAGQSRYDGNDHGFDRVEAGQGSGCHSDRGDVRVPQLRWNPRHLVRGAGAGRLLQLHALVERRADDEYRLFLHGSR